MLRWTCRLRDEFEARGFLSSNVDSLVLSEIKEAEFVNPFFPREFRWETFCSCFKGATPDSSYVTLVGPDVEERRGLVSAMSVDTPASRSILAMNGQTINDLGQRNIDILWLSPTVFISAVEFRIHHHQVHDYEVGIGSIFCFVTQLPAFHQEAFDEPSPLSIDFFQHLAPARDDYLSLKRSHLHPRRFPADYMVRLMSDITQSKDIVLEGPFINKDELRVVLSSSFHPNATLSFGEAPFDDSVSLDVLMDLLKTAREPRLQDKPSTALRRVALPRQVFLDDSEEPIGVMMTFDVESPALSMTYGYYGSPTPHVINVISQIHQAGDKTNLEFEVDRLREGGHHVAPVTSIVHPFLDGRLALENLWIHFYDKVEVDNPAPNVRDGIAQELANAMISCRSTSLCMFTVSLGGSGHFMEGCIQKIRQWDETIFPQLALNWCSKKLTQAPDLRLLISAINQGILYRKTTHHKPYNMSTANACVIFDHIKTEAVKAGQN
jgi:hypothetical protein